MEGIVAFAFWIVKAVLLAGPDVTVSDRGSFLRFEANYLGEYHLGLLRFILEDVTEHRTVLEGTALREMRVVVAPLG